MGRNDLVKLKCSERISPPAWGTAPSEFLLLFSGPLRHVAITKSLLFRKIASCHPLNVSTRFHEVVFGLSSVEMPFFLDTPTLKN